MGTVTGTRDAKEDREDIFQQASIEYMGGVMRAEV